MKRRFGLFPGRDASAPAGASPAAADSGRFRWLPSGARSVAGQMFVLQLIILLLFGVAAGTVLVVQAKQAGVNEARQRTFAAAAGFAHAPGTLAAMESPDPSALLQPRAEQVRKETGIDYLVAFSPAGIRWTHPDTHLIGRHVIGNYAQPLHGHPRTYTLSTPIGVAVESTVPVLGAHAKVVGLVTAGITVRNIHHQVIRQLPLLLAAGGGALLLATAGIALVNQRLRRQTRGLDPAELRRMYDHHDAVLHAAREGVLIVGGDGTLLLANDEARRLLGLPADAEGRQLTDLGLAPSLATLLSSTRPATDEVCEAGDRLLAVSVRPTAPHGCRPSSIVTLRDTTELRAVAGRAAVAQRRLRLLYDAMSSIGTTLDVERTAEELTRFTVPRFADYACVDLLDSILRGGEPEGTMMRRTALSGIDTDHPLYPVGTLVDFASPTPQAIGLGTGTPVLEPDLRKDGGWEQNDPDNAHRILAHGIRSMLVVPLRARGVLMGVASFWRTADAEPFEAEDQAVAEELVARAAVAIDNARRYTREHTTAVTLQRSLLPRGVPDQSALEVAYRYLPAQAGVGGDWFDVIPLPGARVALVVGDVVGHGLHAAATMGRLRTAVANFSALDLSPDELLVHLDELVSRIDSDERGDAQETEEFEGLLRDERVARDGIANVTGASCLYALYDPVAGRVTIARAGHPGPALVLPDGTATYPDVPVSPPLGLGDGMPVETLELELPEGSYLVLYTDGLLEDRQRDIGAGLELLRDALAGPAGDGPEALCTAVLDAVLPTRPIDDVALLVARTRLLGPGHVAEWEVPRDPAAVGPVRAECAATLEAWGLGDVGYTAELILSELITNAVRYGSPPIRVRLLHDRGLICEVSDGSSTAPHPRRAAATDEGGRGLFLVAQLASRWGTRYTARGKVIWAELCPQEDTPAPAAGSEAADSTDDILDQWESI
ncbi:SpoIIE family protein phosphatase [Streptomyces sp. SID8366]|uniref:SpoIIE family protein phosphatase n=4 Tax=unclassified Streptomyces TaxID=2593676 RepID=UPI000DB952BF|nr:SpoIIE family protein phosphatase [Streptomyces sp. SID8366]RAJ66138.1 histidine kinase-like protein [Streptomyces sp. PsTaAH-130]